MGVESEAVLEISRPADFDRVTLVRDLVSFHACRTRCPQRSHEGTAYLPIETAYMLTGMKFRAKHLRVPRPKGAGKPVALI
jgi:hypothetical protein